MKFDAENFAGAGVGFPPKHGLDLLGHNRSAENAGECVADGGFKFALEAVD